MSTKRTEQLANSLPNSDDIVNRPFDIPATLQPEPDEVSTIPDSDPFDPAKLVLDQSYLHDSVAKKVLLEIDMRKPMKDEFFRVHADPSYRLGPIATLDVRDDRTTYVIDPSLARAAKLQHTTAVLYTCINVDDVLFLWPVTVPGSGGGSVLAWHTSAVTAAGKP